MRNINEHLKKDREIGTREADGELVEFRKPETEQMSGKLIPERDSEAFHSRWDAIKAKFVDEPRSAVEEADTLVENVIHHLTQGLSEQREGLNVSRTGQEQTSTEELRLALQRYRALFVKLMSI